MTDIKPTATAGIYAEVIKQIYDSLDKRIRESVSNAYDANAKAIKIEIYKDKFVITDDGDGMDRNDLMEKYVSLGGGDNYNNPSTIGRIGIGALSLFAIGDKIRINTRKKGSNTILTADIDTSIIKKDSQHSVPLEGIILGEINAGRTAGANDPPHFTEIVIEELPRQVLEIVNDSAKVKNLVNRLERILPIKYRQDDPIFDKLPKQIRDILSAEKYTVQVTLHIPHHDIKSRELRRRTVFAENNSNNVNVVRTIPIYPFTLEGGHNASLQIYGYLFINADKKFPEEWQGLNSRVKNVTIESNTYFDYIEDPAATVRVGGEFFILNLDENHAIQSNRSGFAKENNDYIIISDYVRKQIELAVRIVRDNDKAKSIVKKYVKQLERLKGVFQQIASIQDEKDDAEKFSGVDDGIKLDNVDGFSLEKTIKKELRKEKLDGDVIWSGTLDELFHINLEEDDYYSIYVHDSLKEFNLNVGGNNLTFIIGLCGDQNAFIIKKPDRLYVNLDRIDKKDILNIEGDFVKLMTILYLNYLRHKTDAKLLFEATSDDLYKTY